MKSVRIIAVLQIVLAITFAVIAWQIDPGVSHLSKQGAVTCREITKTVQEHRDAYASAMQNVFPLANSMRKVNTALNEFSEKVDSLGKMIRKVPGTKLEGVARGCFNTADAMRDTGKTLAGSASVLDNYQIAGFPQSIKTFDEVIKALSQAESVLEQSSQGTRVMFQLLAALSSLIFLMNAIALLLIAGKTGSDSRQDA